MTTKLEAGTIVDYTLTENDAESINRRRGHFTSFRNNPASNTPLRDMGAPQSTPQDITVARLGYQAHVGGIVKQGDTFPALVMKTFSPTASLLVFPDGNDTLWIPEASEGTSEGTWRTTFE